MRWCIYFLYFLSLIGYAFSFPEGGASSYTGYNLDGQMSGYTGLSDSTLSSWANPSLYDINRIQTGIAIEDINRLPTYRVFGGFPTLLGQIGARGSFTPSEFSFSQLEVLWARNISRWFSLGLKATTGIFNNQGFLSFDLGMVQRGEESFGLGFHQWDYGVVLKNIGSSPLLPDGTPWKPLGIAIGGGFSPIAFESYNFRLQSDLHLSFSPLITMWGIGTKQTIFNTILLAGGHQLSLGGGSVINSLFSLGIGIRGGFALDRQNNTLVFHPGKTPSAQYTEVELWYGTKFSSSPTHGVMLNVAWGKYDDKAPVIQTNPVIFFSPNVDGIKDEAIIPLNIRDDGKLSGWEIEIIDQKGEVVKTFQSWQPLESRLLSFSNVIARLITPDQGVDIPPFLQWDGRNNKGELLPDGVYSYRIKARDLNNNQSISPWQTIVLDTLKREVAFSLSSLVFSPNEDGIQDTLTITITNIRMISNDILTFVIRDKENIPVFQLNWTDKAPSSITWDGKSQNQILPEGVYEISISVENESGQKAFASSKIRLVRTMEKVTLTSSKEAFSAWRGDATIFSLQVSSQELLTNWILTIEDTRGKIIRSYQGNPPLPSSLTWDGKDQKGNIIPDGTYLARLQLFYESGNQPASDPLFLTIDNTPPTMEVRLPYTIFSPLPDSRQRTLPIAISTRASSNDILRITILDETGREVFYDQKPALNWNQTIEWTGLDSKLQPLSEGRYRIVVEVEDQVGHYNQTNITVTLRTGRERLVVSTPSSSLSPRLHKTAIFSLEGNPQGIRSLEFTLRDRENRPVYRIQTNRWLTSLSVPIETLSDGLYTYQATAIYEDGQVPSSAIKTIEIDRIPPRLFLSVDKPAFSPNGDGRRDVLVIEGKPEGRSNDIYQISIIDRNGQVVRTIEWKGPVFSSFMWNGQDAQGRNLPEGIYTIRATSQDAASNITIEWISNVALVRTYPELSFEVDDVFVIPSKKPILLSGITTETNRIEKNEIHILNQQGEVVYEMSTNLWKREWVWQGETTKGPAPDGYYTIRWNLSYTDGNYIRAELEDIIVDREAPRLTVAFSPTVFTPDGDGENDLFQFSAGMWDLSGLAYFDVVVYKVRESLPLLPIKKWEKTFEDSISLWEEKIIWNGIGDDGELVESVQDYRLIARAIDVLYHTNSYETNFTTGVLVERIPEGLRIRMSSIRFALNAAQLTPESRRNLDRVVEVFQKLLSRPERYGLTKDFSIEVSGHTDDLPGPTPDFNKKLSERRAKAVYDYLVSKGIPADKLSWTGYGESRPYKPITPTMSREQRDEIRSRNRRVEFFIRKNIR